MKKTGLLNKDISEVIASMGHTDMLTICDAGLPIPDSVWRIDLALTPGIPEFTQVVSVIEKELKVQEIILAGELKDKNPGMVEKIRSIFPGVEISFVPHTEFKKVSQGSRAIIRTGECTPYANVILVSGVTF